MMTACDDFSVVERDIRDNRLTISVQVAEPVVRDAYRRVLKRVSKMVRIPGFRAGKAPKDVIVRRVGIDAFNDEVCSELLPHFYYRAVEGEARRPVGEVEYVERTIKEGEPFRFTASVDVAPAIELGDYNSLEVSAPHQEEIGDDDVDRELHRLRKRLARLTPPEEGAVIGEGDLVSFRYEAMHEGQSLKTLSGATSVLLGDEDFIPGFGQHLVGLAKDESTSFDMILPESHVPEGLAGRSVNFQVTVFAFQHAELPDVNDEFASSIGSYSNLDDLKAKIRDELDTQARRRREEAFSGLLKERLADIVTCEVPADRLEQAVDSRVAELRERLKGSSATFEEHLAEEGRSEDELRDKIRHDEARDMKIDWALDEIALKEDLKVTEEEVKRRIAFTAQVFRREPGEILEMFDRSGTRVLRKFDLLREKAFSLLKERYRLAVEGNEAEPMNQGDDSCQEA